MPGSGMGIGEYDPFAAGPFPVGVRTIQAPDPARGRLFPCETWYPADIGDADRSARPGEERDAAARPGAYPLVVYSHYSGGHRRAATFLCTHLASHGYVVAALDHSEVVAPELARRDGDGRATGRADRRRGRQPGSRLRAATPSVSTGSSPARARTSTCSPIGCNAPTFPPRLMRSSAPNWRHGGGAGSSWSRTGACSRRFGWRLDRCCIRTTSWRARWTPSSTGRRPGTSWTSTPR